MGYQQPYYVQIQKPPSNGLAITSMILGIVAIVIGVWALIPFLGIFAAVTGFLPAVIAVILGHIGTLRARQMSGTGRGQAMAGLVTGYITLGIIVLTTAFWIVALLGAAATSGGTPS
jgi:hypothetical protein